MNLVLSLQKLPFGAPGAEEPLSVSVHSATCSSHSNVCSPDTDRLF